MFYEVLLLTKSCSTFITLEGFLSAVDSLVVRKGGGAAKGLPTLAAAMELLSGVDDLVLDQVRAAAEALAAVRAGVGLLARVRAPVRHQV